MRWSAGRAALANHGTFLSQSSSACQWEVIGGSAEYGKTDARTIEFRPRVPAGGESVIAYTVRYTW